MPAADAGQSHPPPVVTDTIAAIITGAYQGTVSIIRLSGPDALPIALTVFRRGKPPSSPHRGALFVLNPHTTR